MKDVQAISMLALVGIVVAGVLMFLTTTGDVTAPMFVECGISVGC